GRPSKSTRCSVVGWGIGLRLMMFTGLYMGIDHHAGFCFNQYCSARNAKPRIATSRASRGRTQAEKEPDGSNCVSFWHMCQLLLSQCVILAHSPKRPAPSPCGRFRPVKSGLCLLKT